VGTALLFSGLVGLGTSLILFLSSSVGYLPYSDRRCGTMWDRDDVGQDDVGQDDVGQDDVGTMWDRRNNPPMNRRNSP
jgi:hypothetical protein